MRYTSLLSVVAVVALVSSGLLVQAAAAPVKSHALVQITDPSADIDVQVADGTAFDSVVRYIADQGLKTKFSSRDTGILTIDRNGVTSAEIGSISQLDGVVQISSEAKVKAAFSPNDPYLSYQWGLSAIHAQQAWDITTGKHTVVVAVLDTGIDWNHPDIGPNMWNDSNGYHGYNFIDGNRIPMDDNINSYDKNGNWIPNTYTYHGTHVAGVVGAVIDNGIGIAGMAQVRLMAVKVMNDSGEGTDATVASGIRWAVDNGADIITMSLGVDGMSLTLGSAVQYASNHGVVEVAAAGNSGSSFVSYPAAYPSVIAVGAVDQQSRRASFSNFGTELDLMAPGVQIWSTQGSDSYQYLSGTSTAAPYVAGVAALMLSANPSLTAVDVGMYLNSTATDLTTTAGWDSSTGWGIVNAFAAVQQVSAPMVRISDYPTYAAPNSTFEVTWIVSGGTPGAISATYLRWGLSATSLTSMSTQSTGNTFATFYYNITAPGQNATIYVEAFANIDGTMYNSAAVQVPVHPAPAKDLFSQFLESMNRFIFKDLGVVNFFLLVAVLVAIPIIVIGARARSRRTRAEALAASSPRYTARPSAPQPAYMSPPPPPPPPRYEAYIDLVGHDVMPATIRVVEGTKVVWVNRNWAPPPGISVRSGKLDQMGEHPDGLFQSGMLIAPGDYWSATFHRIGTYEYYLTGIWKSARIVVEPYRPGTEYRPAS